MTFDAQREAVHELEETVGKLESEANRLRSDLASRDETIERLEGELAQWRQIAGFLGADLKAAKSNDFADMLIQEAAARSADNARLTADLSAARERVTVLAGFLRRTRSCANGDLLARIDEALSGSVEDA